MATGEDALVVLRSIDVTLKAMLELAQRRTAQARASLPKAVASDRDLDGQWGDPVLKFNPRDWTGPSFKNRAFSECPPELLDLVAESNEWFASQAEAKNELTPKGKPVADYKRQDAARARGWAKRMREEKHTMPVLAGETPASEWDDAKPEGWD